MTKDIATALRPALVLLLAFTLICGLLYPLAILGLGQALFPHQANGSLIAESGRVIGSELVGQTFASPRYFQPRPSAAGDGYDAAASSGSNLGPASKDLRDAIAERVAAQRAQGLTGAIPADLVTTSASGLDPHLSPEAAFAQVARVAAARNLPADQVRALVAGAITQPTLGVLGQPHVNVLLLNRQLDRMRANPAG